MDGRLAVHVATLIVLAVFLRGVSNYTPQASQDVQTRSVDAIIAALSGASMDESARAVSTVRRSPDLLADDRIRLALIDALRRANESFYGDSEFQAEDEPAEGLGETFVLRWTRAVREFA